MIRKEERYIVHQNNGLIVFKTNSLGAAESQKERLKVTTLGNLDFYIYDNLKGVRL